MKYFIDTEFIEGFHKPLFGKERHFIDLVSIGIFREDGEKYYAISNEFDYNKADSWVKGKVLDPLVTEWVHRHSGDSRNWALDKIEGKSPAKQVRVVQKHFGKSNLQIADELKRFFGCWRDSIFWRVKDSNVPEIYGYYADYDWVLFCSLFGRMIDLPKGFPMYCIDLKQMLDEQANKIDQLELTKYIVGEDSKWEIKGPISTSVVNIDNYTLQMKVELLESHKNYPKQKNEHNSLDDAIWNYNLYNFLMK